MTSEEVDRKAKNPRRYWFLSERVQTEREKRIWRSIERFTGYHYGPTKPTFKQTVLLCLFVFRPVFLITALGKTLIVLLGLYFIFHTFGRPPPWELFFPWLTGVSEESLIMLAAISLAMFIWRWRRWR